MSLFSAPECGSQGTPAAALVTLDLWSHLTVVLRYRGMHPDLAQAAHLLLSIAGPAPEHIEMSRSGPAKYYSVAHAITLDECAKHLQGIKTRGATLHHPEHMTRALAFLQ